MVWRIRVPINVYMNSKLAGTTKCRISFEGVVALKMRQFGLDVSKQYTLIVPTSSDGEHAGC